MAYSQTDIDALKAAVAKGVTRLRMNGEEVQYGSLAEMRRQIRVMEDELAGANSGAITVSYPHTSRGL
ncbi:phage head-tail joining protein [Puniceibacterium confluentis]|uniref:phage head-tail joining protein n=1 Tax=Puniceibacterium confluentis TaxID=1958944 RepID=UPI0011B7E7C7|nr:hypothetical protein [Puniceibacterium confluentis]